MAKVDREQMEQTLDALVGVGILGAWSRKPLGIYRLVLADGALMTPDTKETAMWVMGASAAMARAEEMLEEASQPRPASDMDPGLVQQLLDSLQEINAIRSWEIDEDGDYAIQAEEGLWFAPDRIGAFVSGAVVILQAQTRDQERANASLVADHIRQQSPES